MGKTRVLIVSAIAVLFLSGVLINVNAFAAGVTPKGCLSCHEGIEDIKL